MRRAAKGLLTLGLLALACPLPALAQVTVSMTTGQLLANDGLRPGQSRWQPEAATATGALSIVVSISLQRAYVFRGSTLIAVTTVSTGQPGYDTPIGRYRILEKQVTHHSSLYENAPMPFMQRLTVDGIALHAGVIARSGEPVSHGCIRLPAAFAQRLYGLTALGTTVIVTDATPETPEEALTIASIDGN
jgi:lipoprotein-anchoring transpeptidase ErfK/SrfK